MELPIAVPREPLHHRRIDLQGYRRDDGLYDIEASLVDTKSHAVTTATDRNVPAGADLHNMRLRLVVSEGLKVVAVEAETQAAPYGVCQEAPQALQCLVGLLIGPGWGRAVRDRLGGARGCTHLLELLMPLATVALQTMSEVRQQHLPLSSPQHLMLKQDSCHAYARLHAGDGAAQPVHYTPWAKGT